MRGMLKCVLPVLLAGMVALPAVAMDLTRNGRLILSGDVNSSAELWADAPNRQGLCLVRLRERVVHKIPCEHSFRPKIVSNHHGRIGRFADVVVIQEQPQGNACNGGSLHILGIGNDDRVAPVKVIDYCGGPDPAFARRGDAVQITLPGGAPNRGDAVIPQTVWTFRNGTLTQDQTQTKTKTQTTAKPAAASPPAGRVISKGPLWCEGACHPHRSDRRLARRHRRLCCREGRQKGREDLFVAALGRTQAALFPCDESSMRGLAGGHTEIGNVAICLRDELGKNGTLQMHDGTSLQRRIPADHPVDYPPALTGGVRACLTHCSSGQWAVYHPIRLHRMNYRLRWLRRCEQ